MHFLPFDAGNSIHMYSCLCENDYMGMIIII